MVNQNVASPMEIFGKSHYFCTSNFLVSVSDETTHSGALHRLPGRELEGREGTERLLLLTWSTVRAEQSLDGKSRPQLCTERLGNEGEDDC